MGAEVEGCGEGGEEGGEDFGCAVWGVAFDDGEGAVLRAEEADYREDAAEELGEEGEGVAKVEAEEVAWFVGDWGVNFEILVPRQVGLGALELGERCVVGVKDGADICCQVLV